jgi:hypothetical protein
MYTMLIPIALGSSQTGLTLKARLYAAGVAVGAEITTGFTEEGMGNYSWLNTAFPDGFRGTVRYYVGTLPDGLKAISGINPEGGENSDIKSSQISATVLAGIGSGRITVNNPIAANNVLTLVQGDSYFAADGRALDFSSTSWPVLTDAEIVFTANTEGDSIEVEGSVITPTGATKTIRVELDDADTEALTVGNSIYKYDVQATLANGHIITLVRGEMTVLAQQTTPVAP